MRVFLWPCITLLIGRAVFAQRDSSQIYDSLGKSDFNFYTAQWLKSHQSWIGRTPETTGCPTGYSPIFPVCVDGHRLNVHETALLNNETESSNRFSSSSSSSSSSSNSYSTNSQGSDTNLAEAARTDHLFETNSDNVCSVTQCVKSSSSPSSVVSVPASSCTYTASDTVDYYPPHENPIPRYHMTVCISYNENYVTILSGIVIIIIFTLFIIFLFLLRLLFLLFLLLKLLLLFSLFSSYSYFSNK